MEIGWKIPASERHLDDEDDPIPTLCPIPGFGRGRSMVTDARLYPLVSHNRELEGGDARKVIILRKGVFSRVFLLRWRWHELNCSGFYLAMTTVAMSSVVNPTSGVWVYPSVAGLRGNAGRLGMRRVKKVVARASLGRVEPPEGVVVSRRVAVLGGLVAGALVGLEGEARAGIPTFRKYVDRLDGYSFSYPSGWIQVRGAGADVFFRDPVNLDENVLVEMSSPSSSKFKGVEDLGSPEQAAKKVLQQQLTEFMSTRIGVRREANVTATRSRVADDGRLYYEVELSASSYANNNQLAVMPGDRVAKLEWSRRYLSVLGVENNRLYQLRLQVPENVADLEQQDLRKIMESFQVLKLEA